MEPTFSSRILHYTAPVAESPEWHTMRKRVAAPLSPEEEILQKVIMGGAIEELRPILLQMHKAVNVALSHREWDMLRRAQGQRIELVAKLHDAWSAVQVQIARMQLLVESTTAVFRDARKQARVDGKQDIASQFSNHLARNEAVMIILRDAADMLAWGTIAHLQHVGNRLHRLQKPHLPSEAKLAEYLQVADEIRARQPEKFVLLADLGTLVNVGDLVTITAVPPPISIEFIELKTGKMPGQATIRRDTEVEGGASGKDAKHEVRFERQKATLEDVQEILGADTGYDRSYGARIELHDPPSEARGWTREIVEAVRSVHDEKVVRFTVEGVLLVQVSRGVQDPRAAMAAYCAEMKVSSGPTIDLKQKSTTAQAPSLLGDVFEPSDSIDILLGDTVVLIHVSMDNFIAKLRAVGLNAGLESRSETEKLKKMHSTWRPFTWQDQAIFYGVRDHRMHLGDMWLLRMTLEYVTPSSVAEWLDDGANRSARRGTRELA